MIVDTVTVEIKADTTKLDNAFARVKHSMVMLDRRRIMRLICQGDPNPMPRFHLFRWSRR